MDAGFLRIKIDIKAEYEEYKKRYDYKRKETKREEIRKMFEGFKDFFRNDGHFKFKENEHTLTAEYKDHAIVLDFDLYKTIDSPDFDISMTLKTWERDCFELNAKVAWDSELTLMPVISDPQEQMVHDTRFFKDFLDGRANCRYTYCITGRDEVFETMKEMMQAL